MQTASDIAGLLCCPHCRGKYGDANRCTACGRPLRVDRYAIDVVGTSAVPNSWGARAMQSRSLARVYESFWRPAAFGLSTGWRGPRAESEAALVLAKLEGTPGPWLDLSCGPGWLTRRLTAHSRGRLVVAVDLSRAMLERASVNAPDAVRVRADAAALPFADGSFGAIVNLAAIDLYSDPERALAESVRVLARGGRWLASTFVAPQRRRFALARDFWARAAGVRTPTEGAFRSLVASTGLQRLESVRFGSYLLAWADKACEP